MELVSLSLFYKLTNLFKIHFRKGCRCDINDTGCFAAQYRIGQQNTLYLIIFLIQHAGVRTHKFLQKGWFLKQLKQHWTSSHDQLRSVMSMPEMQSLPTLNLIWLTASRIRKFGRNRDFVESNLGKKQT